MQWTPEHSQWAEQHFDISSTTRSPAHKAEAYRSAVPGHLQRATSAASAAAYQYAWANDDISALTASNLLKKYAEKYSGILEMPVPSYSEAPIMTNGRKQGEPEPPWQDGGIYPMGCLVPESGVSSGGVRKGGGVADAAAVVLGMCSSPGLASSGLGEPGYSASSCGGSHAGSVSAAMVSSQEYGAYGGSYLHGGGYGGSQSLPPAPPPGAPPSHPTLVPAYNGGGSPGLASYSYPAAAGYPAPQSSSSGYSPGGGVVPSSSSSYLPSGIAAPTPLPPPSSSSALPGYPYHHQGHNHLTPIAPTPLNGSGSSSSSSSGSLKRKAFYMTGQGEMDSSAYGNFGYGQPRSSAESPMYRITDNGFDRSAEKAFGGQKQPEQQQRKYSGPPLTPPSYVSSTLGGSRSADSLASFTSPSLSEQESDHHHHHLSSSSASSSSSRHAAEEQLKACDPRLLDAVTSEILQQGPPVDWSDIAGLDAAKAALKEEVLWPMLRPDVFCGGLVGAAAGPPRCLLLFGPRGSGRTLLGRCLASQLGAPFLRLSGSALATKWPADDGAEVLRAAFLVARCRQPSVLFIAEADVLLSAPRGEDSGPVGRLRAELLAQLDALLLAGTGEDGAGGGSQVLVVCSTSRPQDMDEEGVLRRYFGRRVLVPLPDAGARRQMVKRLLLAQQSPQHGSKYCLSEEELASLVQRTEGFSGLDLARLCQEALVGLLHGGGMDMGGGMRGGGGQVRPLTYQDLDGIFCKFQPSISQKEIDTYTEWNKMFGCGQ